MAKPELKVYPHVSEGFTVSQATGSEALSQEQLAMLDRPLSELGLQLRIINMLEDPAASSEVPPVHTVRELLQLSREQLLQRRNLGDKALVAIFEALARKGFYHKGYIVSPEAKAAERLRQRQTDRAYRLGFDVFDDDDAELELSKKEEDQSS